MVLAVPNNEVVAVLVVVDAVKGDKVGKVATPSGEFFAGSAGKKKF